MKSNRKCSPVWVAVLLSLGLMLSGCSISGGSASEKPSDHSNPETGSQREDETTASETESVSESKSVPVSEATSVPESNPADFRVSYIEDIDDPGVKVRLEKYLKQLIDGADISKDPGISEEVRNTWEEVRGENGRYLDGTGWLYFTGEADVQDIPYEGDRYVYVKSRLLLGKDGRGTAYAEDTHHTLLRKDNGEWMVVKDYREGLEDSAFACYEAYWEEILREEYPEGQQITEEDVETAAALTEACIVNDKYSNLGEEERKACKGHLKIGYDREAGNALLIKAYAYGGAKWEEGREVYVMTAELDEEMKEYEEALFSKSYDGRRGYYLASRDEETGEWEIRPAVFNY